MSGCDDIRDLFAAVLENEADAAEAARVRAHMKSCAECAELFPDHHFDDVADCDADHDGVLDFHTGLPAAWWVFPCEGVINWFCLSLFLQQRGNVRLINRLAGSERRAEV